MSVIACGPGSEKQTPPWPGTGDHGSDWLQNRGQTYRQQHGNATFADFDRQHQAFLDRMNRDHERAAREHQQWMNRFNHGFGRMGRLNPEMQLGFPLAPAQNRNQVPMNLPVLAPAPLPMQARVLAPVPVRVDAQEPARVVTPSAAPIAAQAFRSYVGSEAEALRAHRAEMRQTGHYLDFFHFRGQQVRIDGQLNPQADGFVIRDAQLAALVGRELGDSLSQEQIETSDHNAELDDAFSDGRLEHVRGGVHPAFNSRSVSVVEQVHIDRVRQSIEGRIRELTNAHGADFHDQSGNLVRWYTSPGAAGSLFVNNELGPDYRQFENFLDAVQHNQEPLATESILALALKFDSRHAEARKGFVETFTFLFVTKEFPSEGIRQNYLHFLLRCGGIY